MDGRNKNNARKGSFFSSYFTFNRFQFLSFHCRKEAVYDIERDGFMNVLCEIKDQLKAQMCRKKPRIHRDTSTMNIYIFREFEGFD